MSRSGVSDRRPRLLIVDDDEALLDGLTLGLEDRFAVRVARDGVEALERLDEGPADVILLDLRMPRIDGALFLREHALRGITAPVVIASAMVDVGDTSRRLGVRYFLAKPFALTDLEGALARALASAGGDASVAATRR